MKFKIIGCAIVAVILITVYVVSKSGNGDTETDQTVEIQEQ